MNPVIDAVLAGVVAPLGTQGKYSAIHKVPVSARVRVGETGLEGDHQYERKHHGGPEKALHHYSRDHYAVWRDEWPELSVGLTRFDAPGAFGENISTRGLNEADVCVGDVFRLGTVIVQVSQPRQPFSRILTSPRFATSALGRDRHAHGPVRPHPCLRLAEVIRSVVISGAVVRA